MLPGFIDPRPVLEPVDGTSPQRRAHPGSSQVRRVAVKHVDPRQHRWEKVAPFKNDYVCDCGARAWKVGRSWKIRSSKVKK